MYSQIFDTRIEAGNDAYKLSMEEVDGSVRVYWNCNGGPVRSGWDELPAGVRVEAMIRFAAFATLN